MSGCHLPLVVPVPIEVYTVGIHSAVYGISSSYESIWVQQWDDVECNTHRNRLRMRLQIFKRLAYEDGRIPFISPVDSTDDRSIRWACAEPVEDKVSPTGRMTENDGPFRER